MTYLHWFCNLVTCVLPFSS